MEIDASVKDAAGLTTNESPPCRNDFLVSNNAQEHIQMVENMSMAGTSKAYAESLIVSNKNVFYKACLDFKRRLTNLQRPTQVSKLKEAKLLILNLISMV
jgi:hypothetical protein